MPKMIVRPLLAVMLAAGMMNSVSVQAADQSEQEQLFREAMQALEDNRLKSAREALQTILRNDPSLHRARLELAVTYYRSLQYAEARRLAQQVLDDPATPPQVRISILAFLAQVEADEKRLAKAHQFRGTLSAGFMYDSNVNVGPASEFVVESIRFQVQPGATRLSDNAFYGFAALSHTYNPGRTVAVGEGVAGFLWQTQASAYHREYYNEDEYNLAVASVTTGPALVSVGNWRGGMNLRADYIDLGGADLALFTALNPHFTWQFDRGELTWDASVTDRDYRKTVDAGREGTYASMTVSGGMYFLQRKLAAQVGLRYNDFDADDAQWAHQGPEVFAGVQYRPTPSTRMYVRLSQHELDFDGVPDYAVSLNLTTKREDRDRRLALGLAHDIQGGVLAGWQLEGRADRTLNDSNYGNFAYHRTQLSLNLSHSFDM